MIWVETFAPATLKMILTNIAPTWKQEVEIATGKSWLKNIKQVVRDSAGPIDPAAQSAFRSMFQAYATLDTVNYWIWIASMAGEEAYNWSTLAMKYTTCGHSRAANWYSGDNTKGQIPNNGVLIDAPYSNPTSGPFPGGAPPGGICPAGYQVQAGMAIQLAPQIPIDCMVSLELWDFTNGIRLDGDTQHITTETQGVWIMAFSPNIQAPVGDVAWGFLMSCTGAVPLGSASIGNGWIAASKFPLGTGR
jgi:hypothetical protein